MSSKPSFHATADETLGECVPVDGGSDEHHGSGEHRSEAYAHLVEDDTREDEEEDKHIEEGLRALHGSKGRRVPTALREHQVLDGRQDIHKDVGTEHGEGQQTESGPSCPCLVVEVDGSSLNRA